MIETLQLATTDAKDDAEYTEDSTTDTGTDAENYTMYAKGDTKYTRGGTYGTNITHITQRRIQRKSKRYSR